MTGPFRFTAVYNQAYLDGKLEGYNVLFFSQAVVMRGKCPSNEAEKEECKGMKDMMVRGEKITLNFTTKHFASEMWMDWEEDSRRVTDILKIIE